MKMFLEKRTKRLPRRSFEHKNPSKLLLVTEKLSYLLKSFKIQNVIGFRIFCKVKTCKTNKGSFI